MLAASIALLACAASFTGIHNQFAYDDVYVIQRAARLHTLAHWWHFFEQTYWSKEWGGDGYRPLTILGFAAQWVVGHGSPFIYHALNIVLYAAMCVAVFWVMTRVLPRAPAWIAAALFAVHPVHVEAVANVVGQSELTVGLLLTLAVGLYITGRERGPLSLGRQLAIGVIYVAAMLFKEHGITLVALVALAEMTVVRDPRPLRQRLVEIRPLLLGMVALAMAFLWARSQVITGPLTGFNPYVVFQGLHLSNSDRILTMIGLAPNWARLMLWPAHLATEYSPPMTEVAQGIRITQLPGLLMMIGAVGLLFATRKKMPAASFGLGWVMIAISPVSNLVVPAGFLIAERTLLFPSVGAMIFVGATIPYVYEWLAARRLQWVGATAVAALLVAGGWRSAVRQKIWFDDDTLFKQAVVDAPDSYRAHYILGSWYMQNQRMRDGEEQYHEAERLFPYDAYMALNFANIYRGWDICEPAINLYRWAVGLDSNLVTARPQVANCLYVEKHYAAAKKAAVDAVRHRSPVGPMHDILVWSDSAMAALATHPAVPPKEGELPGSSRTPKAALPSTGSGNSVKR